MNHELLDRIVSFTGATECDKRARARPPIPLAFSATCPAARLSTEIASPLGYVVFRDSTVDFAVKERPTEQNKLFLLSVETGRFIPDFLKERASSFDSRFFEFYYFAGTSTENRQIKNPLVRRLCIGGGEVNQRFLVHMLWWFKRECLWYADCEGGNRNGIIPLAITTTARISGKFQIPCEFVLDVGIYSLDLCQNRRTHAHFLEDFTSTENYSYCFCNQQSISTYEVEAELEESDWFDGFAYLFAETSRSDVSLFHEDEISNSSSSESTHFNQEEMSVCFSELLSCFSLEGKNGRESILDCGTDVLAPFETLVDLDLSYCSSVGDWDFSSLAKFSAVKRIGLKNTQVGELLFLQAFPNLEIVDIRCCGSIQSLGGLRSIKSLKSVHAYGSDNISSLGDEGSLGNPQFVNVGRCSNVISLRGMAGSSHITILNASGTFVFSVDPLALCINLQYLDLTNTLVTDLAPLRGLSHLSEIAANKNVTSIEGLEECQSLHILRLAGNALLGSVESLEGCLLLEHIDLSGCIGLQSIRALESCTQLKTIHVVGCSESVLAEANSWRTKCRFLTTRITQ